MTPSLSLTTMILASVLCGWGALAAAPPTGQSMLDGYFAHRTAEIRSGNLAPYRSLKAWRSARPRLQTELREMLGLAPWPEKTPLDPVITGQIDEEDIRVETLHFQSLPGLYVTANLYLPKHQAGPFPTILYVCGHALVKDGDRSFGNKVAYQHHGIWYAQNGYACLIIDTIHRGEIEGIHHGTYRYGMWWWNSRGYTPAGVETWNSIRALDYLATRSEVDMDRIGITGRSGGGVYSWWAAALDERIRVAVPVAGITDLHNQVVDGIVEGHCDCMFMVNTYRWDYSKVAALLAPRPLLIANSDKDPIFPLDGVVRLHSEVKKIYGLYQSEDHLGLLITEGPHRDTQALRLPTFRWFNRFLKGSQAPIESAAVKRFPNTALASFESFPEDAINTTIHESFVPQAPVPTLPNSANHWRSLKLKWLQTLREKTFRSWPTLEERPRLQQVIDRPIDGGSLQHFGLTIHQRVRLPLYLYVPKRVDQVEQIIIEILDETSGLSFHEKFKDALQEQSTRPLEADLTPSIAYAWFAPRGIGPSAWPSDDWHHTQIRRRFMLIGETLDSIRVFDIIKAVQATTTLPRFGRVKAILRAHRHMAVNALYASLFLPQAGALELFELPKNHRQGPDYLNVSRLGSLPWTIAASLEDRPIKLIRTAPHVAVFAESVATHLKWSTTISREDASNAGSNEGPRTDEHRAP